MMNMHTLNTLAATPEPRGLRRYLRQQYPILNPTRSPEDDALLDELYMVKVAFLYAGSPGMVARKTLSGVIVDVKTTKQGRSVCIETDALPFPKWVSTEAIQFLRGTKTPALATV